MALFLGSRRWQSQKIQKRFQLYFLSRLHRKQLLINNHYRSQRSQGLSIKPLQADNSNRLANQTAKTKAKTSRSQSSERLSGTVNLKNRNESPLDP